jgi:hypothetical protein
MRAFGLKYTVAEFYEAPEVLWFLLGNAESVEELVAGATARDLVREVLRPLHGPSTLGRELTSDDVLYASIQPSLIAPAKVALAVCASRSPEPENRRAVVRAEASVRRVVDAQGLQACPRIPRERAFRLLVGHVILSFAPRVECADFVLSNQDDALQLIEIKQPGHKLQPEEMDRIDTFVQLLDEFLAAPANEDFARLFPTSTSPSSATG